MIVEFIPHIKTERCRRKNKFNGDNILHHSFLWQDYNIQYERYFSSDIDCEKQRLTVIIQTLKNCRPRESVLLKFTNDSSE